MTGANGPPPASRCQPTSTVDITAVATTPHPASATAMVGVFTQ